jgi:hypothetical protein
MLEQYQPSSRAFVSGVRASVADLTERVSGSSSLQGERDETEIHDVNLIA